MVLSLPKERTMVESISVQIAYVENVGTVGIQNILSMIL